jgi:hypothetical protein
MGADSIVSVMAKLSHTARAYGGIVNRYGRNFDRNVKIFRKKQIP